MLEQHLAKLDVKPKRRAAGGLVGGGSLADGDSISQAMVVHEHSSNATPSNKKKGSAPGERKFL